MAAKKKAAAAAGAAVAARNNPYLQRIVEDEELRDNVRSAFDSARSAYGRLSNGKAPTRALIEDKKLQRNLRETAEALRDVGTALREGPRRKRRRGGLGRKLMLLVVGAGIALAVSEGLRKQVLDALFGAEEEFEYSSTTSPGQAAPETVGAS